MFDYFVSLSFYLYCLLETQTSHLLELSQEYLNLHEIVVLQADNEMISRHINSVSQFTQSDAENIFKTFTIIVYILPSYWSVMYF